MLAVQDIHVIVTCGNYRRLPKILKLYRQPDEIAFEIRARKSIGIGQNRMLLLDAEIRNLLGPTPRPVESVRELNGNALGVYSLASWNPADVMRVAFYAEDATFVMEIAPDGSAMEVSWHHVAQGWDWPVYVNPDGTRFKEPPPPDPEATMAPPPYGFAKYERAGKDDILR